MNWRTAILGLFALYCTAGMSYTLIRFGIHDGGDSSKVWGAIAIVCVVAAVVNEQVVRRRHRVQIRQRDPRSDL